MINSTNSASLGRTSGGSKFNHPRDKSHIIGLGDGDESRTFKVELVNKCNDESHDLLLSGTTCVFAVWQDLFGMTEEPPDYCLLEAIHGVAGITFGGSDWTTRGPVTTHEPPTSPEDHS